MMILLDANLGTRVQKSLRDRGFVCVRTSEIIRQDADDEAVYRHCLANDCCLITRDHHFLNTFRFPMRDNIAIVFLRHGNLAASEEIRIIQAFLAAFPPENIRGKLCILSPSKTIIVAKEGS